MKDFNKLSRAEMKNVLGGDDPILDGGGLTTCSPACTGNQTCVSTPYTAPDGSQHTHYSCA